VRCSSQGMPTYACRRYGPKPGGRGACAHGAHRALFCRLTAAQAPTIRATPLPTRSLPPLYMEAKKRRYCSYGRDTRQQRVVSAQQQGTGIVQRQKGGVVEGKILYVYNAVTDEESKARLRRQVQTRADSISNRGWREAIEKIEVL